MFRKMGKIIITLIQIIILTDFNPHQIGVHLKILSIMGGVNFFKVYLIIIL